MKKSNIYILFLSLFVTFGLSSCLNDPNIENQDYGMINLTANKIIEIPTDATHEISKTLLPSGVADVTIGEVRLAAEAAATEDIVVTLSTAKSDTSAYALLKGKELFPLAEITVPATVTIKKGERSAPLVVKVNTDALIPEPQFLAISVKSVDKSGYLISGNFGDLKLGFKLKHKYEGRYLLTGSMEHLPNPALYFHITKLFGDDPYTCQLQTVDGSTLIFYEEMGWEDYIYPMMTAAGGYSGWGSFCPQFTFDAAGNVTAVTNAYGQPAGNTRSAVLDPSGINKYDETTKSFSVSYWMKQPSVVTTPPNYRCHMVETYKFVEDL